MTTSVFVFGIKIWTLLRGTECHVKWLKAPALIPFWRHFLEGIIRIFVLDLVPNLKMHSWSFSGPKIILCQTYVSVCLKLLLQSMPRKYCQNILVWFCHLQICGKEILKGIYILFFWVRVRVMVFNATFNNISAISWWSVLLSTRRKPLTCHKSYCITYTNMWDATWEKLSRII
jgi:hypothetical protein